MVFRYFLSSILVFFMLSCSVSKNSEQSLIEKEMISQKGEVVQEEKAIEPSFPDADFGNYLAGFFAKNQKNLPLAAKYYKRALTQDKKDLNLMTTSYILLALSGDIKEAAPLAKEALEQNKTDDLARYILISDLIKKKNYKEALDNLTFIKREGFSRALAPLIEAWSYAGLHQKEKALKALDVMKEEKDFLPFYYFHRAMILDYLLCFREATTSYEMMMNAGSPSIKTLLQIRNFYERTNQVEAHMDFVQAYKKSQAAGLLTESFLRYPKKSELVIDPQTGIAEAFFGISATFGQAKSVEIALLTARISIYLHPKSTLIQLLTAELLEEFERYEEANKIYDTLEKDEVLSFFVSLKKSSNYMAIKDYRNAEKTLQKILKKNPDLATAYYSLAEAYFAKKEYKKAVQTFTKCLQKTNKNDDNLFMVYFMRGSTYNSLNQKEKAIKDLKKALELSPKNPVVLNFLGYLILETNGNLNEAQQMIEEALSIVGENGPMLDSLGWAYFLKKDYKKAVLYLERASTLSAGNALISSHLGDAYWFVRRKREARFLWERALLLSEDSTPELLSYVNEKIKNGYLSQKSYEKKIQRQALRASKKALKLKPKMQKDPSKGLK
ncbi:MAG: tetratricopeptide repeat protein [Alphaproteobacteria bacterium]|nr:tetratricopeptide repeat protein [Alphaproteobacteria bacterium]